MNKNNLPSKLIVELSATFLCYFVDAHKKKIFGIINLFSRVSGKMIILGSFQSVKGIV